MYNNLSEKGGKRSMSNLTHLSEALQRGDSDQVKTLAAQALKEGLSPSLILADGLIAGMDIVGAKFKTGEIYIPHVLFAARAMHAGMDILKPHLIESGARPAGRFIIGTVKGDHHDIGKNLVSIMLQGKGFEVIDLGINVPPEKFVESVMEDKADIVGMSALLSTTMPSMKDTINALEMAGLRNKVKIMIGGGAVTKEYSDEIGADCFGPDAATAAEKALEFVGNGI